MTTDTKPDPLEWLRANARFPSSKADGMAATETLAYVARLQAQVAAWVAAASQTGLLLPDADGMPRQTASAVSLQAQVDALAGALRKLVDWMPRVVPAAGQEDEWETDTNEACAALAAAGR